MASFFGESQSCPPSVESFISFIYGSGTLLLVGLAVAACPHSDLPCHGIEEFNPASRQVKGV
jgi:hypothetical protein